MEAEVEEEVVVVEVDFEVAVVADLVVVDVVEDLEVVDAVEEEASEEEEVVEDVDLEVENDETVRVWCNLLISVYTYPSKKAVVHANSWLAVPQNMDIASICTT